MQLAIADSAMVSSRQPKSHGGSSIAETLAPGVDVAARGQGEKPRDAGSSEARPDIAK
ncbi:hypothetical protein [Halomonas sp. THAF12]|uniref:hypothetical protein n=1 Tax=Halomonas sp. THAF12 TaxID=2587849 RepID=UPI0015627DA2|nr:hypothetical protein [Halomonas sp. THAF12]